MAAPQPLYRLLNFNWSKKIPVGEIRLLEAKITALLVSELKERFRKRYKDWLLMIKSQREGEHTVLDSQFLKQMIQEIILTGDCEKTFTDKLVECLTGSRR